LLYRLKVVEIRLPPLRERREDIPPLVEALLAKINRELHKSVRYVSADAMATLTSYAWPGNVRELENALTRAVVLTKGEVLEAALLPIGTSDDGAPARAPSERGRPAAAEPMTEADVLPLREIERRHIEAVLRVTGWNKRRASALLDISRPTLDRKIEEFGLVRPSNLEPFPTRS
jgi:DNA-binding NtrC family response regulator